MASKQAKISRSNLDLLESNPDGLARKLADLDKSVIMAGVVNNYGDLVGFHIKDEYRSKYPEKKELYYDMGARAAIMYSTTMSRTKDVLSETEGVVLVRKDTKTYFTLIRSAKDFVVSVCFKKSKNSSEINRKIREMFGLGFLPLK